MNDIKLRNIEIFNRLDQTRKSLKLKQIEFSQITGITHGFYSDLKAGRSGISGKLMIGIAKNFPHVNLSWILTGEGEMYHQVIQKSDKVSDVKTDYVAHFEGEPPELVKLFSKISQLPENQQTAIIHFIKGQLSLLTGED